MDIDNMINQLYLQKEHIIINNKDDDNYEYQLNYIEKQIKSLEYEKNYMINNKKVYLYKGPIYNRYNNYLGESREYITTATSEKEALRNISFRIKTDMNKNKNYFIFLDKAYLKIKE